MYHYPLYYYSNTEGLLQKLVRPSMFYNLDVPPRAGDEPADPSGMREAHHLAQLVIFGHSMSLTWCQLVPLPRFWAVSATTSKLIANFVCHINDASTRGVH